MAVNVAWMDDANCLGTDTDAFFEDPNSPAGSTALRICARCTVQAECLQYALDNDLHQGIFGGLTSGERLRVGRRVAA